MQSKWFRLKEKALDLRKHGKSIRDIEISLSIPRSTLSGWFKNIVLTVEQKRKLLENGRLGLIDARKKAVVWHKNQKKIRLKQAKEQALQVLSKINTRNKDILELSLAMLYLGEGSKTLDTSMGNSNPLILKFFISSLRKLYNLDLSKIKCELHLRNDQNAKCLKSYWSKELGLPLNDFRAYIDKRTFKSPTYPGYRGVCVLRCGNVAFQRRLIFLAREFCNIIQARSVSSAGRAHL